MTEERQAARDARAGAFLDFIGLAITVLSVVAIFSIAATW